ncbi:MAG: pyridoxamine 5'-phosphate oxidase family protein [Chloroflexota bacterium]|nr:pyridoxamine 5'-phosphate oxidase family protein [Chloroflexota bacterium]
MAEDANARFPPEPRASRLRLPPGYAEAATQEAIVPWQHAEERIEHARNYWLATTHPEGRPHVAPIWGVWVDGALYFDGIPTARWARNMAANPAVVVHLESGDDVLIIEGVGEDVERVADADLAARIVAAWDAKYGRAHPRPASDGIFRLRPRAARGWSRFPDDATRWRFPDA